MPKRPGRPKSSPEQKRLRQLEKQRGEAMYNLNEETLRMVKDGATQEAIDLYVDEVLASLRAVKEEIAALRRQLGVED